MEMKTRVIKEMNQPPTGVMYQVVRNRKMLLRCYNLLVA